MSQEQNVDLISWWNEQSFDGKDLYMLNENGELIIRSQNGLKERVVATVAPENSDSVIKNLQEKFATVEAKVKEVEVEWIAAEDKLKVADKVFHLKDHLNHVAAIGNFLKPMELLHTWEQAIQALYEENYQAKLKIVELAESLADSEQWKDTTQAFKDITDKWKQAGHLDKNRNDKLWNRIEDARHKFYERKRLHHAEEEKDFLANLDLKLDLVEQAEAIASSTEWKNTSEAFHRLTEEWKTIGPTLNKKNEELWQRFIAAKSAFFEKKREHSARIQVEHEANYAVKVVLVEKAEAMRESKDWSATAQAYASLMEEWKKTGRVSAEKGDELWKRFTEAQEQFFAAKKIHTEEIRVVQDSNYTQKAALLQRAERLKNSTQWGSATIELNELLDEWKKIGPIARSHGNKMWEDFIGARKHFFNRKDANRDQRKQHAEFQKTARTEQARNMIVKLQQDIVSEEEKLEDFKNALENVTPGKKAGELRVHLETLINDSTSKIKRYKEKYAAITDEIKIPEEDLEAARQEASANDAAAENAKVTPTAEAVQTTDAPQVGTTETSETDAHAEEATVTADAGSEATIEVKQETTTEG